MLTPIGMRNQNSKHVVGIYYREDKKEAFKLATQLIQKLLSQDIPVYSFQKSLKKVKLVKGKRELDRLTMMIVLGGDGTYLKALHLVGDRRIPFLGANFGHIGFLTEVASHDLFETLDSYLAGETKPKQRHMLEVTLEKKGRKSLHFLSLNDMVIERGNGTHLIEMSVHAGQHFISRFRADGLIISTPTGSTAYNLSAGGPILHPDVPAVVMTPVCPHSLTLRPVILPHNLQISIHLTRQGQKAKIMVDGDQSLTIDTSYKVKIKKSRHMHLMIVSKEQDYFELLNKKLSFGQRL